MKPKFPKRLNKNQLRWLSLILVFISFIFPFCIRSSQDSLFTVLSLSFTIICATGTILTLFVAILLFDRFGLEGKFIQKKTEVVFELADLLKGKRITACTKGYEYFISASPEKLALLNDFGRYINDKNKKILASHEDYSIAFREIMIVYRNYWLPVEIKEKMRFLEFYALTDDGIENLDDFVKFDFHASDKKKWLKMLPEMTFQDFNSNLSDLAIEINTWLKQHSEIPVDLELEIPHR